MRTMTTRRKFLQAGLLGGAGTLVMIPRRGMFGKGPESAESFCVTLCNHWSYIGIGWQLGIESCVLSATDAMEVADRAPHVKTCINLDARAYEFMADKFPEVATRLKKYLAEGKVELIGGTYGQPLGTMFSGESNIRQLVYGRETIRKALGYEMVTFLEEEEFTHPQIPQIALGAVTGSRFANTPFRLLARFVAAVEPLHVPVPVLMAGQVLEHLTGHPEPTRSEVCHLFDLVARGYAGIVLSDETAVGRDPVHAVSTAAGLLAAFRA